MAGQSSPRRPVTGEVTRLVAVLLLGSLLAAGAPGAGRQTEDALAASNDKALRIVTLAPHLAELVDAVGATELLVGVSAYTDRPAAAAELPVVGDAFAVDQERLTLLAPDLLLAWKSGTAANIVDRLRARGFRIEAIETRSLDDIAGALEQIGRLTRHEAQGVRAAHEFRSGLGRLAERHAGHAPVRVFYQVSASPLYTINGAHYVSELIAACGGRNIFADLNDLAPLVDVEAVLVRDPEAVLASADSGPQAFDAWRRWPALAANRHDSYFLLPASEIGRATPRLLNAGETLCDTLEAVRERRGR